MTDDTINLRPRRSDRPKAQESEPASSPASGSTGESVDTNVRSAKLAPEIETPFKPGDVIAGRYRIEGELGRGGMGAVYRATQLVTNKVVAIKVLLLGGSRLEERKKRFLREARAAAMVRHPSVADVYDFGEHQDSLFMVMELLEGESLRARLRRGVLNEAEAVSLLMPALRGLCAAHAQGVIHRDLKPENIFLCATDPDMLPETVVLDFGLSKLSDPELSALTLDGAVLGTPQYMAPEQATGSRDVDARCDVYAMAVIFYEAVAGHRPFLALSTQQLLAHLLHDPPPPLSLAAPHVSKQFEGAVMRALSRNPADRQPSIEALALEIESLGQTPFMMGTRVSSVIPRQAIAVPPSVPPPATPSPSATTIGATKPRSSISTGLLWAAALLLFIGGVVWGLMLRQPQAAAPVEVVTPAPSPAASAIAAPSPSSASEVEVAHHADPASAMPPASPTPASAAKDVVTAHARQMNLEAAKVAATPDVTPAAAPPITVTARAVLKLTAAPEEPDSPKAQAVQPVAPPTVSAGGPDVTPVPALPSPVTAPPPSAEPQNVAPPQ